MEAKAALERADHGVKQAELSLQLAEHGQQQANLSHNLDKQSYEQGKSIMAFTIMTIIFVCSTIPRLNVRQICMLTRSIDPTRLLYIILWHEQFIHRSALDESMGTNYHNA